MSSSTLTSTPLAKRSEWQALSGHYKKIASVHMRDLFEQDPQRFDNFHIRFKGLLFDYSKHGITQETTELLVNLAKACGVEKRRDKMFSGGIVNISENRAALHTALRRPVSDEVRVDGENIMKLIHEALERIKDFSKEIRAGKVTGHSGQAITDIVNIGIGGSDIGPRMVCEALKPYSKREIGVHFVSNVDQSHLSEALRILNPETTLFIIASKTFTTQETLTNAASARDWITSHYKDKEATAHHFAAVTSSSDKARSFGIEERRIFPLWDWVGGRYSLWSAIGLPICISIGFENFQKLLEGAHDMDRHFQDAPPEKNIPIMIALLGIWHRNFNKASSFAVLPYSQNLHLVPSWLQQLEMESNGKNVDNDGKKTNYATSPVVFGEAGTNGQHSFYQMLHQGSDIIPCDFILPLGVQGKEDAHHKKLIANTIGQTQALMQGEEETEPYRTFGGNRPSSTILLNQLDPTHLGMLLALYEHKIFVQGVIWNINSFDQWGVELGKALTNNILSALDQKKTGSLDSSTAGLIEHIKQGRKS